MAKRKGRRRGGSVADIVGMFNPKAAKTIRDITKGIGYGTKIVGGRRRKGRRGGAFNIGSAIKSAKAAADWAKRNKVLTKGAAGVKAAQGLLDQFGVNKPVVNKVLGLAHQGLSTGAKYTGAGRRRGGAMGSIIRQYRMAAT